MSELTSKDLSTADQIVADMEILRHMLGVGSHIPKRQWCYRNYFNAEAGHADMPSLLRMERQGLVVGGREGYWHATEAGMKAIGLNAKQIKRANEP